MKHLEQLEEELEQQLEQKLEEQFEEQLEEQIIGTYQGRRFSATKGRRTSIPISLISKVEVF